MDDSLTEEFMSYYDAREQDYDELYLGKSPARAAPVYYLGDVKKIRRVASEFGNGHLIDVGCGTGFWLQYYAQNCSQITLIDQSANMLRECRGRIGMLRIEERCQLIQGNFFDLDLNDFSFDSAVAGFFLSHLSHKLEWLFFRKLKRILTPGASLMLIDSTWGPVRAGFKKREGLQERTLNDGRTFTIYKRYFDKSDVEKILEEHDFTLDGCYVGDVFLAATGKNS